jgi:FkbM family methyltransferase
VKRVPLPFLTQVILHIRIKLKLWPIRKNLLFTSGWLKKIGRGQLDLRTLIDPDRKDSVVIEVGSNSGEDTERLLEVFKQARVYCFEPDPRAARKWQDRVDNPRAELEEIAISNAEGEISFYQSRGLPPGYSENEFPDGWDLSGSIAEPKNHTVIHPWSSFDQTITVPSKTLDQAMGARLAPESASFPVTLIWADVQGAERQLIEGGKQTLSRTRYLYTEYSNDELYSDQLSLKKLLAILPGFKIMKIWTNDVLLVNTKAIRNSAT